MYPQLLNFLFAFTTFSVHCTVKAAETEDAKLTVPQMIRKYGYPCEEHIVTTSDGYILTMHRIPHGRTKKRVSPRVVYLQHGLMCSSSDFITAGPKTALGYLLADEGYDVWMGNARGNTYSRNHTYLNPWIMGFLGTFWDFSWHEIGIYDMPAMIDYILNVTKETKLFNMGYSQGTTTFYVMASVKPVYNEKIIAHFSIAPVAFMDHAKSPILRAIAFWQKPMSVLFNILGQGEFNPSTRLNALVGQVFCNDHTVTQVLCKHILFAFAGYNSKEMNVSLLPIVMAHYPAGSSTKQVLHYTQLTRSGYFRQYDYGMVKNLLKYRSIWPPDYDLEKITAPVYLVNSKNDWLSDVYDVDRLCLNLGDCVEKMTIKEDTFNHMDFVFAKRVKQLVYDRIIKVMRQYSKPVKTQGAARSRPSSASRALIANRYNYWNLIWVFVVVYFIF